MRGVVDIGAIGLLSVRGAKHGARAKPEEAIMHRRRTTPKTRLRGEKSLAFGPANDIRRVSAPQGHLCTD